MLAECQFTSVYADLESEKGIKFNCPEEPLVSGFSIFHKSYIAFSKLVIIIIRCSNDVSK